MATRTEKRAMCKTCRGGLTFHDSRHEDEFVWAHNDRPLSETAGHVADPDPATTEYIEVG